jgi:hypothetical protein
MLLSTILTALAATTAAAAPHYAVPVEHHGRAMQATYHGDVRVTHRQVGTVVAPGKMGTSRCRWTAAVHVERRLHGPDGTPVLMPASVGEPGRLTGEHPGDCLIARKPIAAQVARHDDRVRDHVRIVAEADAPRLRAELDHARRYAAR